MQFPTNFQQAQGQGYDFANDQSKKDVSAGNNTLSKFKEPPKESSSLFIRGIPFAMESQDVISFFSQFGEVAHFRPLKNDSGTAFITFYDIRSAISVVQKNPPLKDTPLNISFSYKAPDYSGIRLDEYCARVILRQKEKRDTNVQFPSREEVIAAFRDIGEIYDIDYVRMFFFVTFFDFRAAHKAAARGSMRINDKEWRVDISVEKEEFDRISKRRQNHHFGNRDSNDRSQKNDRHYQNNSNRKFERDGNFNHNQVQNQNPNFNLNLNQYNPFQQNMFPPNLNNNNFNQNGPMNMFPAHMDQSYMNQASQQQQQQTFQGFGSCNPNFNQFPNQMMYQNPNNNQISPNKTPPSPSNNQISPNNNQMNQTNSQFNQMNQNLPNFAFGNPPSQVNMNQMAQQQQQQNQMNSQINQISSQQNQMIHMNQQMNQMNQQMNQMTHQLNQMGQMNAQINQINQLNQQKQLISNQHQAQQQINQLKLNQPKKIELPNAFTQGISQNFTPAAYEKPTTNKDPMHDDVANALKALLR